MKITEKVAHLKGLMEGMQYDTSTDDGKIINLMVELLSEIASEVTEAKDDIDTLFQYSDELDEDLGELESFVYEDDDWDDPFSFDDFDDEDDDDSECACCCSSDEE